MKLPFFLVISGLLLLASPTARAIVDVNHNGLSDLWEKHHNSGNLFPTNFDPLADPDGDGWTHAQEAAVGSDPFDANPPHGYLQPAIVHIPAVMEEDEGDPVIITPEAVTVTWQTLVGKHYTLLFSPDLQEESWIQIGKAFVGSGSEVTYGFEVSGGDKQFWRVAVTDADTDGDTLTDAEERAIGSSPYFPDTDGDGIDDFTAYNSGLNPAGEDSDGDGTPDSALYSVKFELHKEIHNSNNYSGWDYYKPFMGSGDNFRYLTYKNIETYSSSGAALSPDVTDAKRILTYTFLGPGKVLTYPDSHIEYPPPRGPDSQLGEGESRELDPSQTSVVGPTTAPSEIKTVTTTTTAWRIKKQGNTIRSGVHTQVTTAQQILSDGLTYQDYWATYVKPLAWTEFFGGVYGPAPSANFLRGIGSDKWAAETIRDYFSSGNFYLNGIIASPSLGYFGSYGEDTRLKRVRWRWVRFNPLNPFDYEYASPPAAYQKTFHFLVEQTERLGASNSHYGQNPVISTKEAKGIIEIECDGNEGSDWKEISLEKFNTYRIDDPTHLAAMNFTNWGYSTVSFSLVPVEVAVDADRDGEITFDGKDKTTAEKPFRFWINNDQDDVEADEPVDVDENSRDLLDNTIKTKRDLEDFTRIRLAVGLPIDALRDGSLKVGLKFRDSGGQNPSIRIWPNESDTGSDSYLTDGTVAGRQISEQPFGETYSGTVFIPASYWTDRSDTEAHLIFEGTKKGMGELILVLKKEGSTAETETASLHLNLLDVREMYQRARVVNSAEDIPNPWVDDTPPAQTWAWDPWNWSYSEDPDAENVTAVFVHGWRLTYMEFMGWSDSSYKRLWHQGFKGKFYSFRWATFSPTVFTYNDSEYRAWLCGPALASWVNQLPNPGKRSLFAHSMGNVISGAALRSGMSIQRYALCNAAMAAMAYDPDPALKNVPNTNDPLPHIWRALEAHKNPDTDPTDTIREVFGLKNKFNQGSNLPAMINFGLPNDDALSTWVANNKLSKPDDAGHSYYYQETPIAPNISYKLFQAPPNGFPRLVESQSEAFGYVTKSLTRAAGAELRTAGSISSFQNMDDWGDGANHSGFNETHSAQWRWMNQSTHLFWKNLSNQLRLGE